MLNIWVTWLMRVTWLSGSVFVAQIGHQLDDMICPAFACVDTPVCAWVTSGSYWLTAIEWRPGAHQPGANHRPLPPGDLCFLFVAPLVISLLLRAQWCARDRKVRGSLLKLRMARTMGSGKPCWASPRTAWPLVLSPLTPPSVLRRVCVT